MTCQKITPTTPDAPIPPPPGVPSSSPCGSCRCRWPHRPGCKQPGRFNNEPMEKNQWVWNGNLCGLGSQPFFVTYGFFVLVMELKNTQMCCFSNGSSLGRNVRSYATSPATAASNSSCTEVKISSSVAWHFEMNHDLSDDLSISDPEKLWLRLKYLITHVLDQTAKLATQ